LSEWRRVPLRTRPADLVRRRKLPGHDQHAQTTDRLWGRGGPCPFDDVIDVRSPGEFADDHIPGAVNLPVLDDAERAEVGTVYHRASAFAARKIGAGMVSQNIGRHLAGHFADKSNDPPQESWTAGKRCILH